MYYMMSMCEICRYNTKPVGMHANRFTNQPCKNIFKSSIYIFRFYRYLMPNVLLTYVYVPIND